MNVFDPPPCRSCDPPPPRARADQQRRYEVRKRRLLTGKSVPHYAALEPKGRGLMLASDRPFACTHVDGQALEQPAAAAAPMEVEATGG